MEVKSLRLIKRNLEVDTKLFLQAWFLSEKIRRKEIDVFEIGFNCKTDQDKFARILNAYVMLGNLVLMMIDAKYPRINIQRGRNDENL